MSDEQFLALQRELNTNAGEYASKVATEYFRPLSAGPTPMTRRELVAVIKSAWLDGYNQPHKQPSEPPASYQQMEHTEICYWCEVCDHVQDEDAACESCSSAGVVPRLRDVKSGNLQPFELQTSPDTTQPKSVTLEKRS